MKLLFERSRPGRGLSLLPPCDVPVQLPKETRRTDLRLPELSETEISRHYTALSREVYGVNCGFYPLGSCTMKYNPKINEEISALPAFTGIHPLQPADTAAGCLAVLRLTEQYLNEITGMDAMTFQPAAGAHGEFAGVLMIKAYHEARGDIKRTKILVPDSAHGTNPASAVMNGFEVINIASAGDGCVDLDRLREAVGEDTAGLMLTNPNTLGLFDPNILEITRIVHAAGGLTYYDGANLNAIMGVARPGDMGFDVMHLNLHKTFSTPHGGGGPGSGAVGCKAFLKPFLPKPLVTEEALFTDDMPQSIGKVRSFYGNFLVVVRALTYLLTLGAEGIREAAENAVLNANYLMRLLQKKFPLAYDSPCMHEFVLTLAPLKKETGISAVDIAKGLIDRGMHPPTMYFPLVVKEALMLEPTETESKETLVAAAETFYALYELAHTNPQQLLEAPHTASVRRPDEVRAARTPVLRYHFPAEDS